jgi:proton glutamate symport protein
MALGIYVGLSQRQFVPFLEPIASFYTNLLQVSVIPIIGITVITSMMRLLTRGKSNSYSAKILVIFFGMLLATGTVAVIVGYIINPGENMSSDPNIMKIVEESGGNRNIEVSLDDPIEKTQSVSIVDFLVNTVPNNIFKALSTANMLQIIAFCMIFSIAAGTVAKERKKSMLGGLSEFLPVFYKINQKVLLFLPFGSFCLLATQLSHTDKSALFTILNLAIAMLSAIIFLAVICSIILWRCSKFSYFFTVKSLFETLLMAFSTQTSIICVPMAVNAMTKKLEFDEQTVDLTIPLGVPLCQFSTVCFYSIGTIFVVNIFNEHLGLSGYLFIIIAAVLTSIAASGARGVIYYSLMTSILTPLGIPLGNTIALFIAVDPLVDPFGTVFHMYATCSASALCCKMNEKQMKKEEKAKRQMSKC